MATNTKRQSAKNQARKRKAREKDYKKRLKELQAAGIYEPKSAELTRYRKSRINKLHSENRQFLDKKQFHFVKGLADKRENRKALKVARDLDYHTTKTGFFIAREGARKAQLRKSKTRKGEYEIHVTGKYKRGTKAGKKSDTFIPLAPLDKIMREKERFRRMARKLGPLRGNQRLAFKVVTKDEDGTEGYSHEIFEDVDELIEYLNRYEKSEMATLNFLRMIQVVRTTEDTWFREHPPMGKLKKRKFNRTGRNID